ncbi:PREDICTED: serine/threonine-protein kinase ULK4-like, partial [Tauraco erythrolophus]|uniref:serine/threonine-protein kinase ULK4-like n=1 Tax=Tauraco erythrolophus TaxID=121530 RepID=UPI00052368A4
EHQDTVLGNTMHTVIALLNNMVANKSTNMRLLFEEGLVHHICNLIETVALYLEADDKSSIKTANALLLSLLDILHCMLMYTANIVRQTLQAQKSGTGGDTKAAEDLLLINKPLTDLISLLIQLLPSEDTDIFESASQCLSLLVQLYGGNNQESMSPENMDNFAEVLKSKKDTRQLKLLLRIIKRLPTAAPVLRVRLLSASVGEVERELELTNPVKITSNEKRSESLKNDGDALIQTLESLAQTARKPHTTGPKINSTLLFDTRCSVDQILADANDECVDALGGIREGFSLDLGVVMVSDMDKLAMVRQEKPGIGFQSSTPPVQQEEETSQVLGEGRCLDCELLSGLSCCRVAAGDCQTPAL